MNYRYAAYCSGNASRLLKFYKERSIKEFPLSLVYYDGGDEQTKLGIEKLLDLDSIRVPDPKDLDLKSRDQIKQDINAELLGYLEQFEIDYVFVFGQVLLNSDIVNAYKNKLINFHPSLLPAFPGLKAIDQALKTSVQILGNTAHFIDSGVDTGPIILQSALPRTHYVNYDSVLDLQLVMLEKIWTWLEHDLICVNNNKVQIMDSTPYSIFFSS